jgi:polysaccharide biosynthesis transport protein
MNSTHRTFSGPKDLIRLLIEKPKRWLVPAALVAVATVVYAAWGPVTWESSQALIIRNEATSKENGPGKFRQPEDMKTVQETILELARSRGVLEAALIKIGPPANYRGSIDNWPSDTEIAVLRRLIRLTPPKGAEFGKTEVFYLEVQDHDRARCVALNRAIYDELETRFQQLRDSKAQSMIDELVKTVHLAKADLEETTTRLTAIETQVGSDLAELRAMQESASGDNALRKTVTEIRSELREIRTSVQTHQEMLAVLKAADVDPGRLVAAPNRLLESQPALRRLKDGLVDAQLNVARLKGSMSAEHPRVRAAMEAVEEVGLRQHDELAIATRGMEVELRMSRDRQTLLEEQLTQATRRLDNLAALRAAYANELAENTNRVTLMERAEQNLAEARAAHASAKATSLISRIDAPEAGINPVGLKRTTIALLGIFGGLLTGFGMIYLTVPPVAPYTPPAVTPAYSSNGVQSDGHKTNGHRATGTYPNVNPSDVSPAGGILFNGNLSLQQALEMISSDCQA